jgi:adenylate cyclase
MRASKPIQLFDLKQFLASPDSLTGGEAREYVFFKIAYVVAVISHLSWAYVFFLNSLPSMGYYNLAVSTLFAVGAYSWYVKRFSMTFIVLLWLLEIPLHAVLGTLYAGLETMFWVAPLITAIVCLSTQKFSWRLRTVTATTAVIGAFTLGMLTFFVTPWHPLSTGSNIYLFATNFLGILGSLTFFVGLNQYIAHSAETKLASEFNRAEGLLRNILPDPIALRLKDGERLIANDYQAVSVIFADIVDFTAASAKLTPAELVDTLNIVFSEFDTLAEKHGAEKIKTIGDAYMVVVGVPDARHDHAETAVDLALDMQIAATALSRQTHFDIRLRIGVNSGPVVAGVIGKRKFAYDLWGDVVNVASRMESHGKPGQILTTEVTASLLPERFSITPEGVREVKGKGPMPVFSIMRAARTDPSKNDALS